MTHCILCQSTDLTPFIEIPQVPVFCNVLWPAQTAAQNAPRGDIHLALCNHCGHIFNTRFDASQITYDQEYENSLHFSPRFQEYATGLAQYLHQQYHLQNKDIVEIGAGKGDFLKMLCRMGQNRGIGFDPSYEPGAEEDSEITFIQDLYSEKYANHQADLVLSRHVLEHIEQPARFLDTVRRAVGEQANTIVFFEVPNALFTLQQLGIWDIIYEHCSFFTPASLTYALEQAGFAVLRVRDTFNGQFLTVEARPSRAEPPASPDLTDLQQSVAAFGRSYQQKVTTWQQRLQQMAAQNQRAVIWGTGSKGVTFLNVLDTAVSIQYAVDINPRKRGKFVPGTAQEIVPPEFLQSYQPDVVIIMNANYQDEISKQLQALGLNASVLVA